MPQVSITTSVAPSEFPAGTVLGKMNFRLLKDGVGLYSVDSVMPLPPVVTFPSVAPGNYTLSIQRLTSSGLPVGAAYTTPVVVAAPAPVVGDVPVGADVSVI